VKVLCIDGGGIRGVFSAYILKRIEQDIGGSIKDVVDLVAGTSTGAIIAASVATGKRMEYILDLYLEYGKDIFKKHSSIAIFHSFYSNTVLKQQLINEFGSIMLKDIQMPLILPSVDITQGSIHVFRSCYRPEFGSEQGIELWDAILSSCSAPIYFPPNKVKNQFLAVDGGLWANNPSLICLTEGIHHFKTKMEDIKIISLGTGNQKVNFVSKSEQAIWGLTKWISFTISPFKITPKIIDLALNLTSESISYHCELLCGKNYLRINKDLGKEIPFDDYGSIDQLITMADEVYKKRSREILNFLFP
jgi:patatin-like phospholipase/acyl hydrolase